MGKIEGHKRIENKEFELPLPAQTITKNNLMSLLLVIAVFGYPKIVLHNPLTKTLTPN